MALPDFDPDAQKNFLATGATLYDDYKRATAIAQQNAADKILGSISPYIPYTNGGSSGGILGGQSPNVFMQPSHINMIAMRMRWDNGMVVPFQLLQTCTLSNGTVKVIVVQNDKLVDIDDDGGLFPSDALIAKLRLLADKP